MPSRSLHDPLSQLQKNPPQESGVQREKLGMGMQLPGNAEQAKPGGQSESRMHTQPPPTPISALQNGPPEPTVDMHCSSSQQGAQMRSWTSQISPRQEGKAGEVQGTPQKLVPA